MSVAYDLLGPVETLKVATVPFRILLRPAPRFFFLTVTARVTAE